MLKYKIRELKVKEVLKAITVLYSAFGRDLPENIEEDVKLWKALIERDIGKFLIAEEDRKIIGIGGVFLFDRISTFGYMAVLKDYRGKGLGTTIFERLLNIANKLKCETKILYASELGEPLYKKFGFKRRFYGEMYRLPVKTPELVYNDKEIKIFNTVPNWVLTLDRDTMGFDRANYLSMRCELGGKILTIENEGYGLLANKRLGPLIAVNLETAQKIIKKSLILGADHLIIPEHQYLSKEFYKTIKFTKLEKKGSVKMICGKEIPEKLELLYAIGTYAKG